jgi:hypothetical protein
MDRSFFDKGMAILRGACLAARADADGVKCFTVQGGGHGQGKPSLTMKHADCFITEMARKYEVTWHYVEKTQTFCFVVKPVTK